MMKFIRGNRNIIALVVIFLLIFIVYKNTLNNDFVFDDNQQIVSNKWIKDSKYIPEIFSSGVWNFREFYEENGYYYRPLMHVFLSIEYNFFGLNPKNYHLMNILMHFINATVFFVFINTLFNNAYFLKYKKEIWGGKFALATLATIIFSLHPINSEVVNWISAIPELMFTFFYLLSFIFFVANKNKLNYILSVIFFILALLCKETAVTLPILLAIYKFFIENNSIRKGEWFKNIKDILKKLMPFWIVLGVYLFLRWWVLRSDIVPESGSLNIIFIAIFYLFGGIDVLLRNIISIIFPFKLSLFHSYEPTQGKALFLEAIIIWVAYFYLKKIRNGNYNKVILLSIFIFGVPLIPALNVIFLDIFLLSERYLYLPSMGFSLGLSFIILKFSKKISADKYKIFLLGAVICMVGVSFMLFVNKRNTHWKNNLSIFSDAVSKYPNAQAAQFALAEIYCEMGDIEKCEEHYKYFCEIYMDKKYMNRSECLNYQPYNLVLGNAYYKNKFFSLANKHFEVASSLEALRAESYMKMGLTYYQLNETKMAFENLEKALSVYPQSPSINKNLGKLYLLVGNREKANQYFSRAIDLGVEKKEIDGVKEAYFKGLDIL